MGQMIIDQTRSVIDSVFYYTFWYENGPSTPKCVRLADLPGTLSGEILRLKQNLPHRDGDFEIVGGRIQPLHQAPPLPDYPEEPEAPDKLSHLLDLLPIVEGDSDQHVTKKVGYASELQNFLACQGGRCPGTPKSEHIIQLRGKIADGKLVFNKYKERYLVLGKIHSLFKYKAWILQLISGLKCLHSLDIIHRDLRIDNLVFTRDKSKVIITTLESHLGNRRAPEFRTKFVGGLDEGV